LEFPAKELANRIENALSPGNVCNAVELLGIVIANVETVFAQHLTTGGAHAELLRLAGFVAGVNFPTTMIIDGHERGYGLPHGWRSLSKECKLFVRRSHLGKPRRTFTREFKVEAIRFVTGHRSAKPSSRSQSRDVVSISVDGSG
jgi:hypothetical protein